MLTRTGSSRSNSRRRSPRPRCSGLSAQRASIVDRVARALRAAIARTWIALIELRHAVATRVRDDAQLDLRRGRGSTRPCACRAGRGRGCRFREARRSRRLARARAVGAAIAAAGRCSASFRCGARRGRAVRWLRRDWRARRARARAARACGGCACCGSPRVDVLAGVVAGWRVARPELRASRVVLAGFERVARQSARDRQARASEPSAIAISITARAVSARAPAVSRAHRGP